MEGGESRSMEEEEEEEEEDGCMQRSDGLQPTALQ